jgi:hypothetical protein
LIFQSRDFNYGFGTVLDTVSRFFIRINEFSMARSSSGLDKEFKRLATISVKVSEV